MVSEETFNFALNSPGLCPFKCLALVSKTYVLALCLFFMCVRFLASVLHLKLLF